MIESMTTKNRPSVDVISQHKQMNKRDFFCVSQEEKQKQLKFAEWCNDDSVAQFLECVYSIPFLNVKKYVFFSLSLCLLCDSRCLSAFFHQYFVSCFAFKKKRKGEREIKYQTFVGVGVVYWRHIISMHIRQP